MPAFAGYGRLVVRSTHSTAIYVDGEFAGRVGEFSPGRAALNVSSGPHRVTLVQPARGEFREMAVDVPTGASLVITDSSLLVIRN